MTASSRVLLLGELEEETASSALEKVKMVGDGGTGLYLLDRV